MSTASTHNNIQAALIAATETYNAVQNARDLPETFHEAGRNLGPLTSAFRAYYSLVGISETRYHFHDKEPLENALEKANRYLTILKEVQKAPESERLARYESIVRGIKEDMVETLVLGMINNFMELAEGRESDLESYDDDLQDAKMKLEGMEPSVKTTTKGNTYSNCGPGHQFNATGGVQHNNPGSGQQFSGTIQGGIHFGFGYGNREPVTN